MNLTHALAKSFLLLLITCVGVPIYAHASAPPPQCIFDPSGYFYPAGKLPQPFEEFDHLTLWEKRDDDDAEDSPAQGVYTTLGRAYRFDAIKYSGGSFEFTTDAVNGVSYSFTGQFKYPCIFEEFHALGKRQGAIAAEGKLLKLSDGKTVAETLVQLTYSPKPSGSQNDLNAPYPSGRTDLFYAVRNGDLANIRDLLARGADVNVRDKGGMTPLALDIDEVPDEATATAIAKTLIAAGADVNLKDKTDTTPLQLAVYQFEDRKGELVRVLLEAGADANAADDYGTTVLMHAVHAANQEAALIKNVRALIRARADVNARNKLGQTALSIAAEDENAALVSLLKQAGARP
ncbi:MAG TPA: ankyrin repeat domain-containing protein [Pyrinomonadaceae bacterium]|nr:ankyrin repeat domain-containing protein [Pyrinomonadaceae bacterium]